MKIKDNKEARVVLGIICVGIGVAGIGLICSAYLPAPK